MSELSEKGPFWALKSRFCRKKWIFGQNLSTRHIFFPGSEKFLNMLKYQFLPIFHAPVRFFKPVKNQYGVLDNTGTILLNALYVWEYQSTHYGVGEEPSFSLSEKIDLADRFPGLPCNIDAAFSMYGRNFFFKGCLYYELVPKTIFNETSGIESLGGEITKAQDIYDWGLQIDTEKLVVDFYQVWLYF